MVNLAWLGSSQALIAMLGILALGLTAQALGPAGLGVLAVIEAYARTVARLTHPEPWQALIQHGAAALEDGDCERFGQLAWLSLWVDVLGGVVSAGVGVALAFWIAGLLTAASGHGGLMALTALAMMAATRPTGMGLLRLYDRFDLLARIDTGVALLRLALTAGAWALGLGLTGFVLVLIAWSVVDGVIVMVFAAREMRLHGHRMRPAAPRAILAANPGLPRLFVNSNINVTLRQLRQRLDIVLLATVLPAAQLGLYQLARRIGIAVLRLGRPLAQIVYPEYARLAAQRRFRKLGLLTMTVSLGLTAMLLVVLLPFGWQMERVLHLLFGAEFTAAAGTVTLMAVAVAIYMASMTLGPALMSLGHDRELALLTALTTALFFALLIPAAQRWGAEGAALVHLGANLLWMIAALVTTGAALRRAMADTA
jgi:O-antigen/teichoic acid export membrane protein